MTQNAEHFKESGYEPVEQSVGKKNKKFEKLGLKKSMRNVFSKIAEHRPRRGLLEKIEEIRQGLQVDLDMQQRIIKKLHISMQRGLEENTGRNCDDGREDALSMFLSYVTSRPHAKTVVGKECLSMDLGGTYLRISHVKFNAHDGGQFKDEYEIKQEKYKITDEAKTATLFEWVAEQVEEFMETKAIGQIEKDVCIPCGFTFSFPTDQTAIDKGILRLWCKGFAVPDIEGKRDVVELTQSEMDKRGVKVKIVALLNDTVATMVASTYFHSRTAMCTIFGTGNNASYWEKIKDIPKYTPPDKNSGARVGGNDSSNSSGGASDDEMAINIEWGAFDNLREVLPYTNYDNDINRRSPPIGLQVLEKMVAGLYLGEVVRVILVDLIDHKLLFSHQGNDFMSLRRFFREEYSFDTALISVIVADDSEDLEDVADIIAPELPDHVNITQLDLLIIKYICLLTSIRSASLSAAMVAGVLLFRNKHESLVPTVLSDDPNQNIVVVGVEGSAYDLPGFSQFLSASTNSLLSYNNVKFKAVFEFVQNASILGSAIVALMTSSA